MKYSSFYYGVSLRALFIILRHLFLPVGFIVRFLPAFNAIKKEDDYFDDKLYWEVRKEKKKDFSRRGAL